MDLSASKTDNCATAHHAVLDSFVVLHSKRVVTVTKKDGTKIDHPIYDCDVWHFFGDTISKGKKNDHVFHNACLDEITGYYQRRLKELIVRILVWSDNCASQYKCNQNFLKIATLFERHGVHIDHRFAQKFQFKGVWDSAGKVVKQHIGKLELEVLISVLNPCSYIMCNQLCGRTPTFPSINSLALSLSLFLGAEAIKTNLVLTIKKLVFVRFY